MPSPRQMLSLLSCIAAGLAGCAGSPSAIPGPGPLAKLENSLVFVPSCYPEGDWHPPGLTYEDVWLEAADGTRLNAWYLDHPDPIAVVLFCHGNAGNVTDRAEMLRLLRDRHQVAVMALDYRGYGRSEGEPNEAGILQDARAARAWLARRTGVDETDVVLMGRSLGGGVAVDLASRDGARALILQSTFTSLPAAAREHAGWLAPSLMRNRLNSLAKIADYHGPLLLSHGEADQVIPYEQGQKLFAAANEPKQMITIGGGDHNDPQTPEYYRALDQFLAALPPASTPRSRAQTEARPMRIARPAAATGAAATATDPRLL